MKHDDIVWTYGKLNCKKLRIKSFSDNILDPQYSGNLISPMFSMDLLELFYCTSIYGEISTTEYSGTLEKCGDQVTFYA